MLLVFLKVYQKFAKVDLNEKRQSTIPDNQQTWFPKNRYHDSMELNGMPKRFFRSTTSICVSFIAFSIVSIIGLLIIGCKGAETDSKLSSNATLTLSPTPFTVSDVTTTILPTSTFMIPIPSATALSNNQHRSNFLLYQANLIPAELYLFNLQDSSNRFFREGQIVTGQPWSPDGTKFIFDPNPSYRNEAQTQYLSMYDLRSERITELDLLEPARSVFWSPDGKNLFYTVGRTTNPPIQMVVYNLTTGENEVVVEVFNESEVIFVLAGWSPDSRQFAFITKLNGQIDLYTLNTVTKQIQQLTNTPEIEVEALWSPVENHILYGRAETSDELFLYIPPWGAQTLHLIDEFGQSLLFTDDFGDVTTISWSSNGQKLAVSSMGKLCILEVVGLSKNCPLEHVLPNEVYSTAFTTTAIWSADSQWLAFRTSKRDQVACHILYVYEIATEQLQEIREGGCDNSQAYWSR